jgi:ABC-2 type transport system ATP-binding protein
MKQPDHNMSLITAKNLVKHFEVYRKQPGLLSTLKSFVYRKIVLAKAVQDISFEIEEGEMVGFLGPNGAGKTTTLKMLSGILYPSSGTVRVAGFIPEERKTEFKKTFGIVLGQKDQLIRALPPMDSFLLYKEFHEISDEDFDAIFNELADLLNIRSFLDVPVRRLSLGQRMKCELVAALLHNPKILFLDEPSIGLDVVAQKNIRDFIKTYNQKKKTTVLLTSHYMEDIKELCERVIIINFGKIIYDGNFNTLIKKYAQEKIIKITATQTIAKEALLAYGSVEEYDDVAASIRVPREKVKEIAAKLIASDLPIDDIIIEEVPVDDIIRAIFEGK